MKNCRIELKNSVTGGDMTAVQTGKFGRERCWRDYSHDEHKYHLRIRCSTPPRRRPVSSPTVNTATTPTAVVASSLNDEYFTSLTTPSPAHRPLIGSPLSVEACSAWNELSQWTIQSCAHTFRRTNGSEYL